MSSLKPRVFISDSFIRSSGFVRLSIGVRALECRMLKRQAFNPRYSRVAVKVNCEAPRCIDLWQQVHIRQPRRAKTKALVTNERLDSIEAEADPVPDPIIDLCLRELQLT